jgi:Fic family protein
VPGGGLGGFAPAICESSRYAYWDSNVQIRLIHASLYDWHIDARASPQLKPDTSGGFLPNYSPFARHIALAQTIAQLDGELSRLHIHPQWLASLRQEAYIANSHASASIEGNPLTLEQASAVVQRYEADHRPRAVPDEQEIIQHVEYFERVRTLPIDGSPDLTISEIEQTHGRLLRGVLPDTKTPGQIRSPENRSHVSVGRTECTPPDRVQVELERLLEWYYSSGLELPTPIRVAIWFLEFESIHPFRDGNGRVGRALTHRLLYTDGLSNIVFVPLDRPFNDDRRGYYEALADSQQTGRPDPWITLFLEALCDTYQASLRTLERLTKVPAELSGAPKSVIEYILRSGRTSFRLEDITPAIPDYRRITLSLALTRLAKAGYLAHNGRPGKLSRWSAGPKLDAILRAERKNS